jgi:hypothetical protein
MAKKPKVEAEVIAPAPVIKVEVEEQTKKKRAKVDFRATPFVVVIGGSPKIVTTQPNLGEALKFVTQEIPVSKQAKAFVGQFFPVTVEVETKVKLDVSDDE